MSFKCLNLKVICLSSLRYSLKHSLGKISEKKGCWWVLVAIQLKGVCYNETHWIFPSYSNSSWKTLEPSQNGTLPEPSYTYLFMCYGLDFKNIRTNWYLHSENPPWIVSFLCFVTWTVAMSDSSRRDKTKFQENWLNVSFNPLYVPGHL